MTGERDSKAVAQDVLDKQKLKDSAQKVKNARIVLLVIGGLTIAVSLYKLLSVGDEIEGYTGLVEGVLFIGLFFLGAKYPLGALISGLILYAVPHLIVAVIEPESILRGIILKVLFIAALIRGIVSVSQLPKAKPKVSDELIDDF